MWRLVSQRKKNLCRIELTPGWVFSEFIRIVLSLRGFRAIIQLETLLYSIEL